MLGFAELEDNPVNVACGGDVAPTGDQISSMKSSM